MYLVRKDYKMNELKSTEFRLNEINKIKYYFESEIKEQETIIKKLSKFVASLNCTDKILIALSATFGGVSILSNINDNILAKYIGIISSIFTVAFSLTTGAIKNDR